jgi:hypothetical protein
MRSTRGAKTLVAAVAMAALLLCASACGPRWVCLLEAGSDPDFAHELGCTEDFEELASLPLDASIPGATSVKTVVDRIDENTLYFQNSKRYPIHWDFASEHLSGQGLPFVPDLGQFNATEYFSPDRRFGLGAVTYYEQPDIWAYEIAPYDSAGEELITLAWDAIVPAAFFGEELWFHPTSANIEAVVPDLPSRVRVITTDELFADIDYQPLNLATGVGRLRFYTDNDLATGFVDFREIVVLQSVPNDISVTSGIITQEFQTPLSHINVLSQSRGTPNMGLRGAFDNELLRGLDGKWVELVVGPFDWSIREVTQQEADEWWEEHRPEPVDVRPMDLSITELTWGEDILDLDTMDLLSAIEAVVPAFGGKATHYGGLAKIADLPHPRAFVVPMFWYHTHMEENGFYAMVDELLDDPVLRGDAVARAAHLDALRAAIEAAPVNPAHLQAVIDRLNLHYPGTRMRFRSSTNAEDLNSFNGAGLYTSRSGDPSDPAYPVDGAMKTVWASVWRGRAFDEREYWGIDHREIGMSLLVHRSFPDEEANGVAITNNIFDVSGLEPAFYVNVQVGEESVVAPEPGVTSDQFLYYFDRPGQPIVFLAHSNLVAPGNTVLTTAQTFELGAALQDIHTFFFAAYGSGAGFYAMDVEFKFDGDPGQTPELFVKQARPYPGR